MNSETINQLYDGTILVQDLLSQTDVDKEFRRDVQNWIDNTNKILSDPEWTKTEKEQRKRYGSVIEMVKDIMPNNIYYINSEDDQIYVIAQTMEQAIEKWRKSVREEESEIAEAIEPIEPDSISLIASGQEVIE